MKTSHVLIVRDNVKKTEPSTSSQLKIEEMCDDEKAAEKIQECENDEDEFFL